jgi:uncharacterized membrane protein YdjX (TVP38/TMEM64 family)
MSVLVIPWASWAATILGSVVAALLAFALDRYFHDTQATLVAPIAYMLGAFLGGTVTVLVLSTVASWHSSPSMTPIIETSCFQTILVLLAPVGGIIGSRKKTQRHRRPMPPSYWVARQRASQRQRPVA